MHHYDTAPASLETVKTGILTRLANRGSSDNQLSSDHCYYNRTEIFNVLNQKSVQPGDFDRTKQPNRTTMPRSPNPFYCPDRAVFDQAIAELLQNDLIAPHTTRRRTNGSLCITRAGAIAIGDRLLVKAFGVPQADRALVFEKIDATTISDKAFCRPCPMPKALNPLVKESGQERV